MHFTMTFPCVTKYIGQQNPRMHTCSSCLCAASAYLATYRPSSFPCTCIAKELRILNGRLGSDEGIGKTTCNTSRGRSVVDYILAQTDIIKLISTFEVCGPLLISDHSPIAFRISCQQSTEYVQSDDPSGGREYMNFSFYINRMDTFVREVSNHNLLQSLEINLHQMDINSFANLLENDLKEVGIASGILKYRKGTSLCPSKFTRPTNRWFDNDCKLQKQKVNIALKHWKRDLSNPVLKEVFSKHWKRDLSNPVLKEIFFKEKRIFKKLTKQKKHQILEEDNVTLTMLCMKHPNEFWKRINENEIK